MSRRREKRKTLHRIQDRIHHSAVHRAGPRRIDESVLPPHVELVRYTIDFGPMADPLVEKLPADVRDRVYHIRENLHEQFELFLEELKDLVRDYPHIPKLHNYLGVAYQHAGLDEEAEQVRVMTYERFPDYVFAFGPHLRQCVTRGDMEAADRAVRGRTVLHKFITDRLTFHATEVIEFNTAMALYLAAKGHYGAGKVLYDAAKELGPDFYTVKNIAPLFEPSGLRSLLQTLAAEIRSTLKPEAALAR